MAGERTVEFGDPSKFLYTPKAEVFQTLSEIGYSNELIRIDSIYIDTENGIAVGVRAANAAECEGPGVLEGIYQIGASAQTLILLMRAMGRIEPDQTAFFDAVKTFRFYALIVQGDTANIVVQAVPEGDDKRQITGRVNVISGPDLVSVGEIVGTITSLKARARTTENAARRHQDQSSPSPFPFRG